MLRRMFSAIFWAGLALIFYYVATYLFSSTPGWIFWGIGGLLVGSLLGSPKKKVVVSNPGPALMHTVRYSPATCRACGGRGKNRFLGSRCSRCQGRGSVLVAEPRRRCAACTGKGRGRLGLCPVCGGGGWSYWRTQ